MTLAELGAQFREARVHRGLTADDIAKSIKVSAKIIRAIEDGKREELPELVFLRGFIKSYGLFLGFSATDLQKALDYLDESEPKIAPRGADGYSKYTLVNQKKSNTGLIAFFALLALVVVGAGAYISMDSADTESAESNEEIVNSTSQNIESAKEVEEIEEVEESGEGFFSKLFKANEEEKVESSNVEDSAEIVEESAQEEKVNQELETTNESAISTEVDNPIDESSLDEKVLDEESALSEVETNLEIQTVTDESAQEARETVETLGEDSLEPVESIEEVTAQSLTDQDSKITEISAHYGSGDNVMLIEGLEDCWIRLEFDNSGRRQSFTLLKGTKAQINYRSEVEILFGNAGGVNIVLNNENIGKPGEAGVVVTETYK